MENLFSTLFTNTGNTTNTTNASNAIMGCPQNSQFSSIYGPWRWSYHSTPSNSTTQPNCFPPQYYMPPPSENLQYPYTHSLEQPSQYTPSADPFHPVIVGQNAFEMQRSCILQHNALQLEQERRVLDAYKTKVARCKRKLARQRSLSKNSTGASSTQIMDARRLALHGASTCGQSSRSNTSKDLYDFLTPDNKRLRALLRKDLKNSDVGSLGRIVLPKREVEENLPVLNDKEGILLFLRDVYSNQEWALKFKFWSNNKSRMYVLEKTGEFVKQNGLETGDSLILYEDESKNLYFSITKVGRPASVPSQTPQPTNHNYNYIYTPHMCQARDEEKSSLALLIEQLNKKEQEEANSLVAVPPDSACSYTHNEQVNNDPFNNLSTYSQPASSARQPSSSNGKMKLVDDSHVDDCYTGLGVLPDVCRYNFSL